MKKIILTIVILLLAFFILYAREQEYTNQSIARLSYATENTYIQRATDLGYEEAVLNMPVLEGDRLGTTEGRAEIYLGKSNYLRLDNNTKVDLISLPKRDDERIEIQVWTGNVYLSIGYLSKEKDIVIHTADVSIYILDNGLYRIDVRENQESEIFVFKGLVEAAGESGSVLINEAQRLEAIAGHFTSRPSRFVAIAEDSFDRWSEDRDSLVRKRLAQKYLPEELEDFEYELDSYGDWAYVYPYGHVWVPMGIDVNWRPYSYGRWLWLPLYGWTWLPYEPWGWATFHYGRWHWRASLGWYWIPTNIWGPAWVSWYWGYDYIGWAPLSYYGYPGVIINNVFYDRYSQRYYPYNSRAITVIHKNQLKSRNVSKVALHQNTIKTIGKIQLTNKAPNIRPVSQKVQVEKMKGTQLLLRKKTSETQLQTKTSKRIQSTPYKSSQTTTYPRKIRDYSLKPKDTSSTQERKITKTKSGYPSSTNISAEKYSRSAKTGKSASASGKIYNYISRSTKSSKSKTPQISSYKKTSSESSTVSSSSSRGSSRSSSSSSTRSSGSKTRSSGSSSKAKKNK